MKRFLLVLAGLLSLGVGEGIGEWRPPQASNGSAATTSGYVAAEDYTSGSTTCGVQEAMEALGAGGTGEISLGPSDDCHLVTTPIWINQNVTIEGVTTGHRASVGAGSRLTADYDAIELQGTNDTITINKDSVSGDTIHVCEGLAGCAGACPVYTATANESRIVNTSGDFSAFEVDQHVILEQFDSTSSGDTSANEDDGASYKILEIMTTTVANDTIRVSDPQDRLGLAADAALCGDGNERVHGTVITATAGLADWGAINPIDAGGTAAGDVPMVIRFKTAGANTCPFGASCDNNGRRWKVIEKFASDPTKLAVLDPNEFAVDQAGVVVDWVASPCLVYMGRSYLGPEPAAQLRNVNLRDFALHGDGDGDGDGDAYCGIMHEPDADHAGTFSLPTRENISFQTFGDGDGIVSGTDYTYLDVGFETEGVQSNDTGAAGTNDQDDQLFVTHERMWDVSRGYFINSKQTVLMNFFDIGVADGAYRAFEVETGQVSIYEWSSSIDDKTDDLDDLFYLHSTAGEFRLSGGRAEHGAGTILTAETGYSEVVRIADFEMFLQDQDREDFINFLGSGTLSLRDNVIHTQNDAWKADIEAPNAFAYWETGTSCKNAAGAAATCEDGGVIENRNVRASQHLAIVGATNCTTLTNGIANQLCLDTDAVTPELWVCKPSAGLCDTAGEWVLTN